MKWFFSLFITAQIFAADFFSYDLAREIETRNQNWIFSPFSIASCLSMVTEGADGRTAEELRAALGPFQYDPSLIHPSAFDSDYQLQIAQGAWIKNGYPILSSFEETLTKNYQAAIENIDFDPDSVQMINEWIAKNTEQKIQNLIPSNSIDSMTRLVLANALYFQGSWEQPFPENGTSPLPFYTPTEIVQADTMDQTSYFSYYENDKLQLLSLPFKSSGPKPICLLVLPKQEIDWETIQAAIPLQSRAKVHVQVPKFQVEQAIDLKPILKNLGIDGAFSSFADFSKISEYGNLHLSAILHKSFFSFDEKGVEAAAATAAIISLTTAFNPNIQIFQFIANRPFYFLLLDPRNETPLFIGHIQNP